jgi:hypothetical protein
MPPIAGARADRRPAESAGRRGKEDIKVNEILTTLV